MATKIMTEPPIAAIQKKSMSFEKSKTSRTVRLPIFQSFRTLKRLIVKQKTRESAIMLRPIREAYDDSKLIAAMASITIPGRNPA